MKSGEFRATIERKTFTCFLVLTAFLTTANSQRCGSDSCASGSPCTSVRGETGTCISVQKCPNMLRIISSLRRPISNRDRELLRRDICAYEGMKALICCIKETTPDLILHDLEPPAINRNFTTPPATAIHSTTVGPNISKGLEPTPQTIKTSKPDESVIFLANSPMIPIVPKPPLRNAAPLPKKGLLLAHSLIEERNPTVSKIMPATNTLKATMLKESLSELSTKECGIFAEDRIVGGNITNIDDSPWLALLEYKTSRGLSFHCTGSLISNRFVLTAAHCVQGRDLPSDWQLVSVRLGEYDVSTDIDCINMECNDPPLDVQVESVIVHPAFNRSNSNQHHDIALIRLAKVVDFTDFIRPICLPKNREFRSKNYTGTSMQIAGWGRTEDSFTSTVKRSAEVTVTSSERCHEIYRTVNLDIVDTQMCAGGFDGRDSCQGDSGGPLVALLQDKNQYNWHVVGIVSLGTSRCGTEGWPGVYTRVPHYQEWIIKILLQE